MLMTDASESMYCINALPIVHVFRNVENYAKKAIKAQMKRVVFLKEFGDLSAKSLRRKT